MSYILKINSFLNSLVWGYPSQILLLGTGIFLMFSSHFIVFRKFPFILKNTFGKIFEKVDKKEGYMTPFQAVSTALAATVGTGNIAGVTLAITTGGPGAIFWMWIAALVGMTTKMAEVSLALASSTRNSKNEKVGGPMYYIERGLGNKFLAKTFAFFGMTACFGIGCMTQANSITNNINSYLKINKSIIGIVICILLGLVLIGGVKRIGEITEKIVPLMAFIYILGGLVALFFLRDNILNSFKLIFSSAFTPQAASGGFLGSNLKIAMKSGIARGVFTNEAGLGSAPIAHATSSADHPIKQGMWAVFEVFMDTIVVCTITGLVVISSGLWKTGQYEGAVLTAQAFNLGFRGGHYIVSLGLILFAFTTIIGWSYYGEKCSEYLFNKDIAVPFRIIYILAAFIGAVGGLKEIWTLTDTLNGMMAIPNLLGLILLRRPFEKLVKDFFDNPNTKEKENFDYMKFFKY